MRTSTGYVQLDPAVIEQARQMDLLTYLKTYEPSNLMRVTGNVYCTREHDSLKISKRYSFRLLTDKTATSVHLFESAVDLLSYATLLKCSGEDYKAENLLSLSGVYQPKKELGESKIPIALTTFLNANPQIKTIYLHLDNDKTGRLCTEALKILLKKDYEIVDDPPPVGKDFNDFLLSYLGVEQTKSRRERSDVR